MQGTVTASVYAEDGYHVVRHALPRAEVEALLGQTVARALSACIEERSCRPQRFDNPAQFAIDK